MLHPSKMFYGTSHKSVKQYEPPLPHVTQHSGGWPYTVTLSIDQILHKFLTFYWSGPYYQFDFLPNYARFPWNICNGCGMQTEDAHSSGHLVVSNIGTCMRSNVDTNLSWTFEFRTWLGTSVFLKVTLRYL